MKYLNTILKLWMISLTTLAFAGIIWAIIALFTGELSNADYGIYK